MTTDLEFITNLMACEIDKYTLKRLKQRIERIKDDDKIEKIIEDRKIPTTLEFLPATKTIKVNYKNILNYLEKFENAMKMDIPNASEKEMKMLKLLTVYKIFLHEMYHSQQFFNAYELNSNDLESEIIRSIYNMNRKTYLEELKIKTREQIMEERTKKTNDILMPYFEINPIERKSEIESLRRVRQILLPVRGNYMNVYDELYVLEQSTLIKGYDRAEVPFIQMLEILKKRNPNYRIMFPYGCPNKYEFLKVVEGLATEQERLDLGLNVRTVTKDRVYEKIEAILFR